jgi:hypothetical protein
MFWPDDGGSPVAGAPALAVSMLVCQAHWAQAPALAGGWRGDAVFIGACWSIWPLSGCNYRPDQGTGRRRHQDKQD